MDPRNILNEDDIFQFLELKFTEGAQTVEGIKSLTEGSFLEGDSIAEALVQAGRNANVDAYFITARLIQEQGRSGTATYKISWISVTGYSAVRAANQQMTVKQMISDPPASTSLAKIICALEALVTASISLIPKAVLW